MVELGVPFPEADEVEPKVKLFTTVRTMKKASSIGALAKPALPDESMGLIPLTAS